MFYRFVILFGYAFTISHVSGLYFYLKETGKKCFREDIPSDTMVVGKYKVEVFDKILNGYVPTPSGFGMKVEVLDPNEKLILSRVYAAEGRFVFTSVLPGEHFICLNSNSSAWFSGSKLKVYLEFLIGEKTNDYEEIARRDKLSQLQVRVRQLIDQVDQIKKDQDYQRTRETRFRETSESVNFRVFLWAVIQVLVLVVVSFGQSYHLKNFFISKKLV